MTSVSHPVLPPYLRALKLVATVAIAPKSLSIGLCSGGRVIRGKEAA